MRGAYIRDIILPLKFGLGYFRFRFVVLLDVVPLLTHCLLLLLSFIDNPLVHAFFYHVQCHAPRDFFCLSHHDMLRPSPRAILLAFALS